MADQSWSPFGTKALVGQLSVSEAREVRLLTLCNMRWRPTSHVVDTSVQPSDHACLAFTAFSLCRPVTERGKVGALSNRGALQARKPLPKAAFASACADRL
jgi:hypothetical protein